MMLRILAGLISLVWASIVVGLAFSPLVARHRHEIDAPTNPNETTKPHNQ